MPFSIRSRAPALGGSAIAIAFALASSSACGQDTLELTRDEVVVASFCIERAVTAEERARGLRGAEPLCENCGLLIELPITGEVCIENNGVSFALDVLYVDEASKVVVVERAVPAGDATSRCHPGILQVLEVSAGAADAVLPGDQLKL